MRKIWSASGLNIKVKNSWTLHTCCPGHFQSKNTSNWPWWKPVCHPGWRKPLFSLPINDFIEIYILYILQKSRTLKRKPSPRLSNVNVLKKARTPNAETAVNKFLRPAVLELTQTSNIECSWFNPLPPPPPTITNCTRPLLHLLICCGKYIHYALLHYIRNVSTKLWKYKPTLRLQTPSGVFERHNGKDFVNCTVVCSIKLQEYFTLIKSMAFFQR